MKPSDVLQAVTDPLVFAKAFWPKPLDQFGGKRFYDKQEEAILSIRDNDETVIVAGNQLGKDYLAGFVCLSFFMAPHMYFPPAYVQRVNHFCGKGRIPKRRVVTTSVKDDHLRVLWAEIGGFVTSSVVPLLAEQGGPLVLLNKEMRLASEREARNPESYMVGCVSERGEGLAGHHADYTLLVVDEASGVDDMVYDQACTWAKRKLIFGNPNRCRNFFYRGVKQGDLKNFFAA